MEGVEARDFSTEKHLLRCWSVQDTPNHNKRDHPVPCCMPRLAHSLTPEPSDSSVSLRSRPLSRIVSFYYPISMVLFLFHANRHGTDSWQVALNTLDTVWNRMVGMENT